MSFKSQDWWFKFFLGLAALYFFFDFGRSISEQEAELARLKDAVSCLKYEEKVWPVKPVRFALEECKVLQKNPLQ